VARKRTVTVVPRHTRIPDPPVFAVVPTHSILHLKRFTPIEGVLVNIPTSLDVFRVDAVRPSTTERRFQRTAGEVAPCLIDVGAFLGGVHHPESDRSRIRDKAEAFFAFADGLFGESALDEICSLPGKDVEQSEIFFGWRVRFQPVRGEHTERLPRARTKRRGLYSADAGAAILLLILRACHEFASLDVAG